VKKLLTTLVIGLFGLSLLTACSQDTPAPAPKKPSEQSSQPVKAAATEAKVPGKSGTVLETMDAATYTYLKVDTGTETFWAATNKTLIKIGDAVVVPEGTPMPNFYSKSLDRTFEMVYFVSSVLVGGEMAGAAPADMPAGHPPMTGSPTVAEKADVDFSGITTVEGGVTVADVYANKAELAGKSIKVRGKVVKYSAQIMGKNWLHIQDGSGTEGSNDLTITTTVEAKVGDTVLASGVLAVDRDFGYGYQYGVIVEDADVIVE